MSFDTISAAILTKLQSISEIQIAYDYHKTDLEGFPAATFEPSANTNTMFTNDENLRGYTFDIVLYQEYNTTDRQTAVGILRRAVDAVIEAFDEDYNLSNGGSAVVDFCFALPSTWGEVTMGEGAAKFAILTLVCNKEVSVT